MSSGAAVITEAIDRRSQAVAVANMDSVLPRETGICKILCTKAGSLLTDPFCLTREDAMRFKIVDHLNPTAWRITNWTRKFFLILGIVGWAALALIATWPGMGFRALANKFDNEPYIHLKSEVPVLNTLTDRKFSVAFKNYPGCAGGYSISDAGVVPLLPDRIDAVCAEIKRVNADVFCACEIMDPDAGFALYDRLKGIYSRFYFHMGTGAVLVPSGLFVASKFEIHNPQFTRFPLEALVGRAQHAAKGFFGFNVVCSGKDLARIYVTHIQHSEITDKPEKAEQDARKLAMKLITDDATQVKESGFRSIIQVIGDLNMPMDEFRNHQLDEFYNNGDTFPPDTPTWGGDKYCAKDVSGRKDDEVSNPKRLDYSLALKGTARKMTTTLIPSNFNCNEIKPGITSDHEGLLTLFEEIDI